MRSTLTDIPPIIRFEHVGVRVGDKFILSDISFEIGAGEKAVFRGKSGSGKSSVLKTLLGLFPLASGQIFFQGEPLGKATIRQIRACAAYVGQEPVLGADTVRQALLLPFQFKAHRGAQPSEFQLAEALLDLHLPEDILNRECRHVSGGEKQRIVLARALLLRKSLFLVDEVTSALDPESKRAVLAVFADPQLTVLSVAHDPDWIAACGRVFNLDDGCLTQEYRRANP